MDPNGHLWAIGFDSEGRAGEVREEITRLGWGMDGLLSVLRLDDVAVVVRSRDGSYSFNREPFLVAANVLSCSVLGMLVGLVVAAPMTGATVGALLGGVGSAAASSAWIDESFVRDVERLMKPGTSALFVLDEEGDMDIILHHIRGLGGTVLKTNVDMERARLIQATLADSPEDPRGSNDR
jgi:uncharacterized membrane protein